MCPTRYRTATAGGPLLRVAKIRRTTDTHYRHIPFHFSHNERTPVQIRCNIFIGVRIIKEMPGSVASGTHCTSIIRTGHRPATPRREIRNTKVDVPT